MIEVRLTWYQADMVALRDADWPGTEIARSCGGYVWVRGSAEGLAKLRDHFQHMRSGCWDSSLAEKRSAKRAQERIAAALTKVADRG